MANFINKESTEKTFISKCVCGISNSTHPYDTSIFPNNSTTFYTQITYFELEKLLEVINSMNEVRNPNMNINYIIDSFKNSEIQIIFRFLCSYDCRANY